VGRPGCPPGPYLVAGLSRAGEAATAALLDEAPAAAVAAHDTAADSPAVRDVAEQLRGRGVRVELGGDGLDLLAAHQPRCVVKSPGIEPSATLIAAARGAGTEVIDELELGWRRGRAPVLGITGSNGKSTVAALCLAQLTASSQRAALAGNTTFGPPLSGLDDALLDWVVAEVSSYQLAGSPTVLADVGVFTNLSAEHAGYHGGAPAYAEAKRRLFVRGERSVRAAAVGVDEEFGRSLAREIEERGGRVVRFGTVPQADLRLAGWRSSLREGELEVDRAGARETLHTRLAGRHNALNAVAGLAAAEALELDPALAREAAASTPPVPGRLEPIDEGQPFDVIVDFAHNPAGVEATLSLGREYADRRGGRLLALASALPVSTPEELREMGRLAGALTDELVVATDIWAASTPPVHHELLAGAGGPGSNRTLVEPRGEAIAAVVERARSGDVVMVLGRGARSGAQLDGQGVAQPFDDREEARAALARLGDTAPGWSSSSDRRSSPPRAAARPT